MLTVRHACDLWCIMTCVVCCAGAVAAAAVDNVILRDPPVQGVPLLAGLNLVPGAPQQPCPGRAGAVRGQQQEGPWVVSANNYSCAIVW